MRVSYKTINHPNEKEFKKGDICCTIFKKDDFKEYKKNLEDSGKIVHVMANTSLKEIKDDDDKKEKKDYVKIPDKDGKSRCFKIYQKRHRMKTVGYMPVSEYDFILIEKGLPILIWLIPILIGLLIGLCIAFRPSDSANNIPLDDGADWDGEAHKNGSNSQASAETITIPGFSSITVDKNSRELQLYNLDNNTVNFVYTITENLSEENVGSFDTQEEAMTYIADNEHKYQNDYSTEGDYKLIDMETNEPTDIYTEYKSQEDNGKFNVVKTESKVIYITKAIAPGKAINWDVLSSLDAGEHNLQFIISTYDVDTNVQCYGAVLDVKATVR